MAQVVLVAGASGTVGAGIARAFLARGDTVVAPARSAGSKAKVEAALAGAGSGTLLAPILDYGTLEGALALGQHVKDSVPGGIVDHVVSSAGGVATPGALTDATPEGLQQVLDVKIAPHIYLAKALVPLLRDAPTTSYTVITGMLGEVVPWPSVALTAVANAAVYGAVLALQAELRGKPPRVNELRIAAVIRPDDKAENPDFPGAPAFPASRVGAAVLGIAGGEQRDAVVRLGEEQLKD
eukprot:scaffold6.g2874.t1